MADAFDCDFESPDLDVTSAPTQVCGVDLDTTPGRYRWELHEGSTRSSSTGPDQGSEGPGSKYTIEGCYKCVGKIFRKRFIRNIFSVYGLKGSMIRCILMLGGFSMGEIGSVNQQVMPSEF